MKKYSYEYAEVKEENVHFSHECDALEWQGFKRRKIHQPTADGGLVTEFRRKVYTDDQPTPVEATPAEAVGFSDDHKSLSNWINVLDGVLDMYYQSRLDKGDVWNVRRAIIDHAKAYPQPVQELPEYIAMPFVPSTFTPCFPRLSGFERVINPDGFVIFRRIDGAK
jgi:hypothetical protein